MTAIQHITNATRSIRPTKELTASVDGAVQGTLESAVDARLTALSRDISTGVREH